MVSSANTFQGHQRRWYHSFARKSAASHITLDHLSLRSNIKIKDIHGNPKSRAGVRDVHDTRDMTLHRRTTQEHVDLVIAITVSSKILDHTQACLSIGNRCIQVALITLVIDGEPLKGEIASRPELGFHRTGMENRRLHVEFLHAVLDYRELERNYTRHLNSSAEGDFAVSLREVEISDGEFGAGDVDGKVNF